MGLVSFLSALFDHGRVRVEADDPVSEDAQAVDSQLLAFERESRDDLPGDPPEISLEAARFGAVTLYRACQFLVFRDTQPEVIHQALNRQVVCRPLASTHYSADLTFQYLPDVVRLARAQSQNDPLVAELIQLAGRWPLSSVGIAGAQTGDVAPIVVDTCLLRIYVDRIIKRQDLRRLANDQVREAALQAMGAFPQLAPEVAEALQLEGEKG